MQSGEPVRHRTRPDCGIGVIEVIYSNGTCKATFGDVVFSGIPLNTLHAICRAVDAEYQLWAKEQVSSAFERCDYDGADKLYR